MTHGGRLDGANDVMGGGHRDGGRAAATPTGSQPALARTARP